jgi:hypothetical protein
VAFDIELAGSGRDVHDPAVLPPRHRRHEDAAHLDDAEDVGLERLAIGVRRDGQWIGLIEEQDGRVVDEDVRYAHVVHDPPMRRRDGGDVRHVHRYGHGSFGVGSEAPPCALGGVFVAAGHGDV